MDMDNSMVIVGGVGYKELNGKGKNTRKINSKVSIN